MLFHKTLIATAALVAAGAASADPLSNGSFESGTVAGWTSSPGSTALITTESTDVAPGWGSFAAQLTAGRGTGLYTYLYQTFTLNAGDSLSGAAKWVGNGTTAANDDGYVSLSNLDLGAPVSLFFGSIQTFGNMASSPWTYFSFTATQSGNYTLTSAVANKANNLSPSSLLVDFRVSAVPEPAGLPLTLAGLGALAFVARRRKTR